MGSGTDLGVIYFSKTVSFTIKFT